MLSTAGMLDQVDVVRLRLHLEFDEDCHLPPGFALQLRRELLRAGRLILGRDVFARLFEPSLPADAFAVRRFQRPAPTFVLRVGTTEGKTVCAGDDWQVEVIFVGTGISFIPEFIRVFQHVGQSGIYQGRGRYMLIAVSSLGASGEAMEFISTGRDGDGSQPLQLIPLAWQVESSSGGRSWRIEMITPARLVSQGKPLFHPTFKTCFPFILRRVGAMLWHWGGCDYEIDPQPFLAAAARVEVIENKLYWHDWKAATGGAGEEPLGGISGSMVVSGPALDELFWVLSLGALLHIGKGAAYGAGEYRLTITKESKRSGCGVVVADI